MSIEVVINYQGSQSWKNKRPYWVKNLSRDREYSKIIIYIVKSLEILNPHMLIWWLCDWQFLIIFMTFLNIFRSVIQKICDWGRSGVQKSTFLTLFFSSLKHLREFSGNIFTASRIGSVGCIQRGELGVNTPRSMEIFFNLLGFSEKKIPKYP